MTVLGLIPTLFCEVVGVGDERAQDIVRLWSGRGPAISSYSKLKRRHTQDIGDTYLVSAVTKVLVAGNQFFNRLRVSFVQVVQRSYVYLM